MSRAESTSLSTTREAYNPHGAALLDYWRGNAAATLICFQDGKRDDVPAAFWFRSSLDPLEELALDLCRGDVLDIGAGTGLHTLELQRRGFNVKAIDVVEECVSIMRERGVLDATTTDFHEFEGGPFDTIVCLCNGLDKVGTLTDLPRFLAHMRRLLAPGGQLLADSFDLRVGADAQATEALQRKTDSGRYFGELDLVFEYNEHRGSTFSVLQVDSDTLERVASQHQWSCEVVARSAGHYLARLCPNRRHPHAQEP
jgi:2-polyprenyl-3-methyl-5-hydroxy-6-metoxy-1,4-benzoquinol methylase